MKKLLLLLLIPLSSFSQYTSIPDVNFEQALINSGYDFLIDGFVETSAIDTVTELMINKVNSKDPIVIKKKKYLEDVAFDEDFWNSYNYLPDLKNK